MTRLRRPAHELRTAIDCMPLETKRAMLDALEVNPIIVGAYTDREGGVCPMLAAHRNGGRTSFESFASAWDRYTRAGKGPRRATEREVRTLSTMLEASIAADESHGIGVLGQAIADHRRTRAGRVRRGERTERRPRTDTGERDRSSELAGRAGWAWLRPFRRLDDYERALEDLRRDEAAPAERERELV